ncbi:MAG: hypothetical protein F6K47_01830 [Symploca sp. SIO2E6]|nr:hypothetical protein [Symploca sp. SIO2E6]
MMPRKFDDNGSLISYVSKKIALAAGVATLMVSSSALAFDNHPTLANSATQLLGHTTLAQNSDDQTRPQTNSDPRFTCQFVNGDYTVMYHPESKPGQAYPWAVPSALGGGWTPELRCNEISRRLEFYRPDGLVEMRTGVENNYDVICVTTQQNPDCRIVLTVPPNQDPEITRNLVFENLTVADSGQQTQGVTTFVGGDGNSQLLDNIFNQGLSILGIGKEQSPTRGSGNIDLRPFLDAADGGTGTQLRGGNSVTPSRQLNPDLFR